MASREEMLEKAKELGVLDADKLSKDDLKKAVQNAVADKSEADIDADVNAAAPAGKAAKKASKTELVEVTAGNIKAPLFINIPAGKQLDSQTDTDLFGMIKRKSPESLEHISGSLFKVVKTVSVNVSNVIPAGTLASELPKDVYDSVKHLKGMFVKKEMFFK